MIKITLKWFVLLISTLMVTSVFATTCPTGSILQGGQCKKDCNGDGDVLDTCDVVVTNSSDSCRDLGEYTVWTGANGVAQTCHYSKTCPDATSVVYPNKCACPSATQFKLNKGCNAHKQCVWDCNHNGNFDDDLQGYSSSTTLATGCTNCRCPNGYSRQDTLCKKDCNGDGDYADANDVVYPAQCPTTHCSDLTTKGCHNNKCVLSCNGTYGDGDDILTTGCTKVTGDQCSSSDSNCSTINECNPVSISFSSCGASPAPGVIDDSWTECNNYRNSFINKRYTPARCLSLLNQSETFGTRTTSAQSCTNENGISVSCSTHYMANVCGCPIDAPSGFDSNNTCRKDCNGDGIFETSEDPSSDCPTSCSGKARKFINGICWQDCNNNGVFNEANTDRAGVDGCSCLANGIKAYNNQGVCRFDCNDNGRLNDAVDMDTSGCICGAKVESRSRDLCHNTSNLPVKKEILHCPYGQRIKKTSSGDLYNVVTDGPGLNCCNTQIQSSVGTSTSIAGCGSNSSTRTCVIERSYVDTDGDGIKDNSESYVGDIEAFHTNYDSSKRFSNPLSIDELKTQYGGNYGSFSCTQAGSQTPTSIAIFQCYESTNPGDNKNLLNSAEKIIFKNQNNSSYHRTFPLSHLCYYAYYSGFSECHQDDTRCLIYVFFGDLNNNDDWDRPAEGALAAEKKIYKKVSNRWQLNSSNSTIIHAKLKNSNASCSNTITLEHRAIAQTVTKGRNTKGICKKDCNMDRDYEDEVDVDTTATSCNVACVNGGTHDRHGYCKKDCNSNGSVDDPVDVHESKTCCSNDKAYRRCTNDNYGCDRKGSCVKTCLNSSCNPKEMPQTGTCYQECPDGSCIAATGTCTACTSSNWNCCSSPPCSKPWNMNIFTTYPDPL